MDDDALWDRYTHFAEMYRFYFDLLIKLLVFFYAAVGTYLTVFFARANFSNTRDVCTLLLPLVVGFVVAELFDHIEMKIEEYIAEVDELVDKLKIGIRPEIVPIAALLRYSFFLFGVPLFFLTYLFIYLMIRTGMPGYLAHILSVVIPGAIVTLLCLTVWKKGFRKALR